jgi:NADH dehydrogenase [ubiquinone] 1 alpha subcomplex assembly factor 6
MIGEAIRRHPLSDCAALVREHDPDRYLAALFAPAAARRALFALYAFDHEIAKVRHIVSEPLAGMVRLQWWRDALDAIESGEPRAQPVVAALHADWARLQPLRPRLDAAIEARATELSADPPADLATLEQRLEGACGEIARAAVDLLDGQEEAAQAAARHVGLALGLVRLVQSAPRDLRRERMLLPGLLLERHRADPEHGAQAPDGRSLRPVVAELAARARAHLREARRHRSRVPRRAIPALLHACLLDHYLRRLARAGYDAFADVSTRPAARAPLELLARHLLGRY